jgi:hypothetical protein
MYSCRCRTWKIDFGRLWQRWDNKIKKDLTEIVHELDSGALLKFPVPVEVLAKESTDLFLGQEKFLK